MFKILVLLLLAYDTSVFGYYCNIKSCQKQQHTKCQFESDSPSQRCILWTLAELTSDEIQTIVKLHNNYRQYVANGSEKRGNPGPQPATKTMPDIEWDDELADIAQTWANQCQFEHDSCRDVSRFSVGQNIGQIWNLNSSQLIVDKIVQKWYDEVNDFNKAEVTNYTFNDKTGHYTQMIWANTSKIGCGSVRYTNDNMGTVYLVCNYGPAGNYIGEPIYTPVPEVPPHPGKKNSDVMRSECSDLSYN